MSPLFIWNPDAQWHIVRTLPPVTAIILFSNKHVIIYVNRRIFSVDGFIARYTYYK